MTYLLLAEKPSAAKNFAKALGGMSGAYNGQSYRVQMLFGHMLEFCGTTRNGRRARKERLPVMGAGDDAVGYSPSLTGRNRLRDQRI